MKSVSGFFNYVGRCWRTFHQIHRAFRELDLNKVILVNDFAAAAILTPLFDDNAPRIQKRIERAFPQLASQLRSFYLSPIAPSLTIPRQRASAASKAAEVKVKALEKLSFEAFPDNVNFTITAAEDVPEEELRRFHERFERIQESVSYHEEAPLYFGLCLDEHLFFTNLLRARQITDIAIYSMIVDGDAAKSLLSFLKTLNTLTDYSSHFPDLRPPPGPPDNKERERARGGWFDKVFGGTPAPA